ncbi:MAG: Crp/Fnr family transcriptional regulator [Janthinobacterium lividum]
MTMPPLDGPRLRRCLPLLASLTDAEIAKVSARSTVRRYARKERIVEQGTVTDAMYFVVTGSAHVVMQDSQERQTILSTLHAGDYFGEMSLIDGAPHAAGAISVQPSEIFIVENSVFAPFLPLPQAVAGHLMRTLVRRLRHADQNIESLALLDVQGRVARVLLDFAVDDGHGDLRISDRISMTDLGKMIGASRETVARVMREFQDKGLVRIEANGSMSIRAGTASGF